MEQNRIKACPRCAAEFECNDAAIAVCQCSSVPLDALQRAWIGTHYKGCLCRNCLEDIRRQDTASDTDNQ